MKNKVLAWFCLAVSLVGGALTLCGASLLAIGSAASLRVSDGTVAVLT